MKQLHNKVNIVPVIAKADVLTKKEMLRLKKRVCSIQLFPLKFVPAICNSFLPDSPVTYITLQVMEEIEKNEIKIYPLPDCDSDEDEDYKEQVSLVHVVYIFIYFQSYPSRSLLQNSHNT